MDLGSWTSGYRFCLSHNFFIPIPYCINQSMMTYNSFGTKDMKLERLSGTLDFSPRYHRTFY
jgi:hypothetical protein